MARYEQCDRCGKTGKTGELDLQLFQLGRYAAETGKLFEICPECADKMIPLLQEYMGKFVLEFTGIDG